MKFIVSITFMLFSLQLHAEELGISVGPKNELILTHSSCTELLNQQNTLCEWTKSITPNFTKPLPKKCEAVGRNKFRIKLAECLPVFAQKYHQKKLLREGPNCWGTAMSFKELSPTPRFMWPEEMHYWMESPLCRKLAVNEAKMPGDIINVYAPEKLSEEEKTAQDAGTDFWKFFFPNRSRAVSVDLGVGYTGYHRLLHSVTYINPLLSFGKDSPSELDRFYFHPLEEVYGRPRKEDFDCQENQNLSPHLREYENQPTRIHGRKCSYFTLAYRCENFNNYFNSRSLSPDEQITWTNIQLIQGHQKKLLPLITDSKIALKDIEIKSMTTLADVTALNALQKMQNHSNNDNTQMLTALEYFSAHALRKTLEQASLIKPKN